MKRSLTLSLALAMGALVLWQMRAAPSVTARIQLSDLVDGASAGPLLAPHGNLGEFSSTPFLTRGWAMRNDPTYRVLPKGEAGLRFYLSEPATVLVELEGRAESAPEAAVRITHSSKICASLTLKKEWAITAFELPASELKVGLNELTIASSGASQWRNCRFRVKYSQEKAAVGHTKERLCIPFGAGLEVPILLHPGYVLALDSIEDWLEPGAPSLTSTRGLTVRLQASGEADQTWELAEGSARRLALPVVATKQVTLTLTAHTETEPLPGQSGLALRNPGLETTLPEEAHPATASSAPAPISVPSSRKPNIVLYVVDTLRADQLHSYGSARSVTPNFDALAHDGVRFADFVAQSSWTKASMGSIFTSLLPRQHGAEDFPDRLIQTQDSLAPILQKEGYETYGFVTNPFVGKAYGFAQGFTEYRERPEMDAQSVTSEVISWLEHRDSPKPFLLYVHILDPHLPYSPPARFRPSGSPPAFTVENLKTLREAWEAHGESPGRRASINTARGLYRGEISNCDDAFGRLISTLKSRGLYDDSLVVLVSDHGEQFFEHNLCDHMNSLYKELIQVPFILKLPACQMAGTVVQSVWQHIDIAPTLLHLVGTNPPQTMQGVAYTPGAQSETGRPAFFSLHVGLHSDKYGQGAGEARADMEGIRVGPWVLHRVASTIADVPPVLLFNREQDPAENSNLAFVRPDIRVWLSSLLQSQIRPTGASRSALPDTVWKNSARTLQYLR